MPELPEVESARRLLSRWLTGRRVARAEAEPVRTFRGAERARFEAIRGRLLEARRKGKYLLLTFEGGRGLLAHLGMTGKFVLRPAGHVEPYSRARFVLDDGSVIHYRDPRLLGRMEPAPAERLWELPAIKLLGVDPVNDGLSVAQLRAALAGSRQELKVALMDQSRVAGLGNIYAAEALYRAGLHPQRRVSSLKGPEWERLAQGIHATLRLALEQEEQGEEIQYLEEGGGVENPFLIYGRAGGPCAACGREIKSITQGGRTTHFCPGCQPRRRR